MIRSCDANNTIQIDKMVMDAVRQHMRSVCGDVLDQLKGDNYEVSSHMTCIQSVTDILV